MLQLDGASHSGSGTLVRFGVALAALTGRPLRVVHARERRPKPGLAAQHVAAVLACAELCGGKTQGVALGAREFELRPGDEIRGGDFAWDIGTAGSATMLALGLLPVACFAATPVRARISGGIHQDFAPSPQHLAHVLLPLLARMGVRAEIEMLRPGYVPAGEGVLELRVEPVEGALRAIELTSRGDVAEVHGLALASHLEERRVAERMARACTTGLAAHGLHATIELRNDTEARQAGANLSIWAVSTSGCRFGVDRAGAPRRSSEAIGRFAADALVEDLASGATTDRHLADQLVLFAALAEGHSRFSVPSVSPHVASNLWLAELFGARTQLEGRNVEIDGIALAKNRPGRRR
jgi:RNA 3'-terminal phosphate cyclase (ATP)